MQELISRLRGVAERNSFVENTSLYTESADLIEVQAAEIEKYKALCDQMGVALDKAQFTGNPYNYHTTDALEAWRAMK